MSNQIILKIEVWQADTAGQAIRELGRTYQFLDNGMAQDVAGNTMYVNDDGDTVLLEHVTNVRTTPMKAPDLSNEHKAPKGVS